MVKIQWRRKDIEQMKQLYINHQPIKIIARFLNRTPTSINKALSVSAFDRSARLLIKL